MGTTATGDRTQLAAAEQELQLQQDTQTRLLREQREKQRQLDKLEATREAEQEAQGTYGTKVILQSDLTGICGLVAQLGQVDPQFQLALETAAGARLGQMVVEDDAIAARAIELLKQRRAGRATFLPLNRLQPPRIMEPLGMRSALGFIDLAVNLIRCDARYRKIFAYVFGSTVVFETLEAGRSHLGKGRIVTLEGDLLETTGAMSGGSQTQRATLHFGRQSLEDSAEVQALRKRLADLEQILSSSDRIVTQKAASVKQLTQALTEARQQSREAQLRLEQGWREQERLQQEFQQIQEQLERQQGELQAVTARLAILSGQIPKEQARLQLELNRLAQLEATGSSQEWQELQAEIKVQETQWQQQETALRQAEEKARNLTLQNQRLAEKLAETQERLQQAQTQQQQQQAQSAVRNQELQAITEKLPSVKPN
ncbi:MAG: hypothetical protein HC890_20375 [Chloroflexaceae bacterium]|nr:hypothetical protein [Chloroflexaceae bacterium]